MNSRQIESWALRVIDCVKKGQPNEDFLVELKREWILENKAARRIAGHANAARGENILWLIGVDEKEGVIGVEATDMASWYDKVKSCFNDLPPRLLVPLNIPVDDKTIVALLFETDRAPYVIKNPCFGQKNGGSVEFEVPWREGTSIRTANRSDLIRLLAPLEFKPNIDTLDGKILYQEYFIPTGEEDENEKYGNLELYLQLYIVPRSKEPLVIPFYKCNVIFKISELTLTANIIRLKPSETATKEVDKDGYSSNRIDSTRDDVVINGPGKMILEAVVQTETLSEMDYLKNSNNENVDIEIHLVPTSAECSIVLTTTLPITIFSHSSRPSGSWSYSTWA